MNQDPKPVNPKTAQPRSIPAVSAVFEDGTVLEMVVESREKRSSFAVYKDGQIEMKSSIEVSPLQRLVPYSPGNNLLKNEVVLFPSEAEEYDSEESLIQEIQEFIHRYVDISPLFEKIAVYYVLLTWVYDSFNELPYLRLRGDPGSGKTRFLLTAGALCYKPIFASGASTVSPLFRILDAFRGTLIIDEGDFRLSDERAEIIKILNNGNAKGFPVLRSEVTSTKEYNPKAYAVFGPKIIATRGFFEDAALESRCITEEMGQSRMRNDIPINLPASVKEEALGLRNKLLMFRFRNLHKRLPDEALADRSIEPRLNQIFIPILSIIEEPNAREDIRELAKKYNTEMIAERGMQTEAQVLEIIRDMLEFPFSTLPSVRDITSWFIDRHSMDYERKVTSKWIGNIIRKRLNLKTQKSHGLYIIPPGEKPKLELLYERYGISGKQNGKPPPELPFTEPRPGGLGDIDASNGGL